MVDSEYSDVYKYKKAANVYTLRYDFIKKYMESTG